MSREIDVEIPVQGLSPCVLFALLLASSVELAEGVSDRLTPAATSPRIRSWRKAISVRLVCLMAPSRDSGKNRRKDYAVRRGEPSRSTLRTA